MICFVFLSWQCKAGCFGIASDYCSGLSSYLSPQFPASSYLKRVCMYVGMCMCVFNTPPELHQRQVKSLYLLKLFLPQKVVTCTTFYVHRTSNNSYRPFTVHQALIEMNRKGISQHHAWKDLCRVSHGENFEWERERDSAAWLPLSISCNTHSEV